MPKDRKASARTERATTRDKPAICALRFDMAANRRLESENRASAIRGAIIAALTDVVGDAGTVPGEAAIAAAVDILRRGGGVGEVVTLLRGTEPGSPLVIAEMQFGQQPSQDAKVTSLEEMIAANFEGLHVADDSCVHLLWPELALALSIWLGDSGRDGGWLSTVRGMISFGSASCAQEPLLTALPSEDLYLFYRSSGTRWEDYKPRPWSAPPGIILRQLLGGS